MRQDRRHAVRRHAVRRHAVRRHCSRATLQHNEFVARWTCSIPNLKASGAARRAFGRPKLQQNQLAAGRHCSMVTLQQGDIAAERICRLPERPEVDSARQGRRSEACRKLPPIQQNHVPSSQFVVNLCRYGLVLLNCLSVAVRKSIQSGICR